MIHAALLLVFASAAAIEPAIIAGAFMTFNSVLTLYLTRRWGADEERRIERDVEEHERTKPTDVPQGDGAA